MAKPIHMFELPVEIEPFRPGVERGTSLMSHIVVSAAVVAFCARVTVALAKPLEDLSGPPVEMGIDDPHDLPESVTQRGLFRGRTPNSEVQEFGVRPRNRPPLQYGIFSP